MRRTIKTRLLGAVAVVCAAAAIGPLPAFADSSVAKVNGTEYATLDEAVSAASTGGTIEVLADCSTSKGLNLNGVDLTIKGVDGSEAKPKISFEGYGTHVVDGSLTFQDVVVAMNASENPGKAGGTTNLIDDSNLVFNGCDVTITNDHADKGGESAVFLYQGSNLDIRGGSHVSVSGYNDTASDSGIYADGSERDENLPHFQINIADGSSLDITDCGWGGMTVNPCDISVSGQSSVNISKCGADGGKQGLGCYDGRMTISDKSTVDVSNNYGSDWGIFINDLEVDGTSTLTANNNNGDGIDIGGTAVFKSGATLNVTGNAIAGLNVRTGVGDVTLQSGVNATLTDNATAGIRNANVLNINSDANVLIARNKQSGIRNNSGATAVLDGNLQIKNNDYSGIYVSGGTVTVRSGTITHNHTDKYGGGIFNGGTTNVDPDVVLYNNHADISGDDIYSIPNKTMSIPTVGSDWMLDDCSDMIDGYYDDSSSSRWEAHKENQNHIVLFKGNAIQGDSEVTALKAAHGVGNGDKISLPGLEKKIIVDGNEVDEDTVAGGQTVSFQLESNVPENLGEYVTYNHADNTQDEPAVSPMSVGDAGTYVLTFHDKMSSELTKPDNFKVTIERAGEAGIKELVSGQYTLVNNNLDDGCTFEVVINLAALYNNDIINEADFGVARIVVTYTATVQENVTAGNYYNTAWVSYPDGESEEDTVTVKVYGLEVFKYDQAKSDKSESEKALAGAKFQLYQKDSEGNVIQDSVLDLEPSGEDGYVRRTGLKEGDYFLKEIEAPVGYVCSDTEVHFNVPDDAGEKNIVHVDFANTQVPHTGGSGTTMFTIAGAVVLIAAGVLYVVTRKRKGQNR